MNGYILDISGHKYGMLKVISFHEVRKSRAYWVCACDCGRTKICNSNSLRTKNRLQSCGCLQKLSCISNGYLRTIHFEGKKFENFKVLQRMNGFSSRYHAKYKCKCNCGNIFFRWGNRFSKYNEGCKSCSCLAGAFITVFNQQLEKELSK